MAHRRRGQPGTGADRGPTGAPPTVQLVVGLGDPERERRLLPALAASGDLAVVARCLSADEIVAALEAGRADAVLVATDLHRLTDSAVAELARSGLPAVLLAPDPVAARWQSFPGHVLPLEADAEQVRQALLAALRGEHPGSAAPSSSANVGPIQPRKPTTDVQTAAALAVLAVAGGHGSPGRTTVAVSLASALGAIAPTILVDADVVGASVAAYLDLDPTRNLYMLAHAEPDTPRDWDRALAEETQPLGPRSPYGVAIVGVPKPELRSAISLRFVERLLPELRQRYRYVVLDVGADLLGAEAAAHRTALTLADQVLLVASTDLVGLWHARQALALCRAHLTIGEERLALILNRHDRRYHHGRTEIEWALGVPAAGVIPYDHRASQRAMLAQQALVFEHRSRAAGQLRDLAERVHGGRISLPPEPTPTGRGWRRRLPGVGSRRSRSSEAEHGLISGHDMHDGGVQGAGHGDGTAPIH